MRWLRTINGLYKTELIHKRGPWENVDAVEYATLEWVDWFNTAACWNLLVIFLLQNFRRCIISN